MSSSKHEVPQLTQGLQVTYWPSGDGSADITYTSDGVLPAESMPNRAIIAGKDIILLFPGQNESTLSPMIHALLSSERLKP